MDIVILGAGLSGLALANELSKQSGYNITIIEKQSGAGGMARSFQRSGINLDLGSHRLHPSSPLKILEDIRSLIGLDLLLRPRNGLLCLRGKKVKFPLDPWNAFVNLGPLFAGKLASDMISGSIKHKPYSDQEQNFETVLEAALGSTLCRTFYFPYARKLWGLPPEELSDIQARRRVSSASLGQIAGKMFRGLGSRMKSLDRSFYYPRKGFGQIAEGYVNRLKNQGVCFLFDHEAMKLIRKNSGIVDVELESPEGEKQVPADYVFSSLPVTDIIEMLDPPLPSEILDSAKSLVFRATVLVYLELDVGQLTSWDAHYSPEPSVLFSRMSEPKNYSGAQTPGDKTIICLEVPCEVGDKTWTAAPVDLGFKIIEALDELNISTSPVLDTFVVQLRHAYPVYKIGFQRHLHTLLDYLDSLANFVSFGRQGLFWYANAHHVIQASQELAGCFGSGKLNQARWREIRQRMNDITVAD